MILTLSVRLGAEIKWEPGETAILKIGSVDELIAVGYRDMPAPTHIRKSGTGFPSRQARQRLRGDHAQ
jgi:hypothetical protein